MAMDAVARHVLEDLLRSETPETVVTENGTRYARCLDLDCPAWEIQATEGEGFWRHYHYAEPPVL